MLLSRRDEDMAPAGPFWPMDWETFKGEANLYDEAAMFVPGCLFETMPAG
jgi:hypothetical protein